MDIKTLLEKFNENQKNDKIILCLNTFGGDPDSGFRIGRALQHYYPDNVTIIIFGLCKSSGTLTALTANQLIIGDMGELGPLDIQVRNTKEIGARNSGLDIFKSMELIEDRLLSSFVRSIRKIRYDNGINTQLSGEMGAKLSDSLVRPIIQQIDPYKMGEHQRAMTIAQDYGSRLIQKSNSLKDDNSLDRLIAGYPSHTFVIDRKEASELFKKVFSPSNDLRNFYGSMGIALEDISTISHFSESNGIYIDFFENKDYIFEENNDDHHDQEFSDAISANDESQQHGQDSSDSGNHSERESTSNPGNRKPKSEKNQAV